VALGIEGLVAEEDDAVVEQRLADVTDSAIVEILADVDAVNLGADAAGDRPDLDLAVAHEFSSACRLFWLTLRRAASRLQQVQRLGRVAGRCNTVRAISGFVTTSADALAWRSC
jgi:hypothetical protein